MASAEAKLPGIMFFGSLNVLLVTTLTGIGIINVLFHNGLGRNDLEFVNYLSANLGRGITALRAYQILTLQTVLHPFFGNIIWDTVQDIFRITFP